MESFCDSDEKLCGVHGLGHVRIHPCDEATFAVSDHGMGGHGHNRQMLLRDSFLGAYGFGRFKPVHIGHLHVHQHQIKILLLQCRQSFPSAAYRYGRMALFCQQAPGQAEIDQIIVSYQDVELPVWRRACALRENVSHPWLQQQSPGQNTP